MKDRILKLHKIVEDEMYNSLEYDKNIDDRNSSLHHEFKGQLTAYGHILNLIEDIFNDIIEE